MILLKTFFKRRNKNLTFILFVFLSLFALQQLKCQDIHLTSFNYSPLFINPANTGNFYGNWRAAVNFRNQSSATGTGYATAIASGDKLFTLFNHKIGAGLLLINDRTGGIEQSKVMLSGSYIYKLNDNYFSGGVQAGMVFSNPNADWKIYDPLNDRTNLPNNELSDAQKSSYLDINFGVLWWRSIGIFEPKAGIALAHLNSPNKSIYGGTDKVPITSTLHGSLKSKISDEIYVTPTFLFANSNGNILSLIGADVGYKLLGNRSSVKEIFGGLYMRNGLASELNNLAFLIGTTVGRLDIALSYDLNFTDQRKNGTSFEISLIYRSISTVLNSYSIPCERF